MTYGSTPQINPDLPVSGVEALFKSQRDIALLLDKTVRAGYGDLSAGVVMAEISDGSLVPYVPAMSGIYEYAVSFALTDVSGTSINIPIEDSYRFVVGDTIAIRDDDGVTDGGAITDIDRDTHPNYAVITFTNSVTATVAKSAHCFLSCGDAPEYSTAKYILDKAVDTGIGEGSVGAITSVVISNAVLNQSALIGVDNGALTDLGAVEDGNYLILK